VGIWKAGEQKTNSRKKKMGCDSPVTEGLIEYRHTNKQHRGSGFTEYTHSEEKEEMKHET